MDTRSPLAGPKFNDVDRLLCCSQWRYRKHIKITSPMVMATTMLESIKNRHFNILYKNNPVFGEEIYIFCTYWSIQILTWLIWSVCGYGWTSGYLAVFRSQLQVDYKKFLKWKVRIIFRRRITLFQCNKFHPTVSFPFFVRFVFNARIYEFINKEFEFRIYEEHDKVIFKSMFILKIRFAKIS